MNGSTEKSFESLLRSIFGDGWYALATNNLSEQGNLIGDMFQLFSIFILAGTVAVIFVFFLVFAIDSSKTGKPLGERYSAIYAPLRWAISISFLAPAIKGFSLLQVLILSFFVALPVNLANDLGELIINTLVENNSIIQPKVTSSSSYVKQMMRSAICTEYFNQVGRNVHNKDNSIVVKKYADGFLGGFTDTFSKSYSISFDGSRFSGQPEKVCGGYVFDCSEANDSIGKESCLWQRDEAEVIFNEFRPIARQMVVDNLSMPDFSIISERAIEYDKDLQEKINSAYSKESARREKNTSLMAKEVRDEGFLSLGKWYMTITQVNNALFNAATAKPKVIPMDLKNAPDPETGIIMLLNQYSSTVSTSVNDRTSYNDEVSETASRQREIMDIDNTLILGGNQPLKHSFLQVFGIDDEPIIGLQKMGNTMLSISSSYLVATEVGGRILDRLPTSKVTDFFTKDGNDGNSDEGGITLTTLFLVMAFIGAVLLYYIPFVPFIMWTIGLMNYVFSIIESLIAAPLFVAAHALPAGEGLTSDYARRGYMIILNLVIQPILMVFGLIFGLITMLLFTKYFNSEAAVYATSLMDGRFDLTGVITNIFLTAIIVSVDLVILHRSHALIYEMYQHVMNYVGGESRDDGTRDATDRVTAIGSTTSNKGENVAASSLGNKATPVPSGSGSNNDDLLATDSPDKSSNSSDGNSLGGTNSNSNSSFSQGESSEKSSNDSNSFGKNSNEYVSSSNRKNNDQESDPASSKDNNENLKSSDNFALSSDESKDRDV